MRDFQEKIRKLSLPKPKDGPICGQCSCFSPITSEIQISSQTDPDQILSELAFNGISRKGLRLCSEKGITTAGDSCVKLSEFTPRVCGNCQLFHPDTTSTGIEASMTAAIITREKPNQTNIQYGKMGCYDNAYGSLSNTPCTEPDKFQPKK